MKSKATLMLTMVLLAVFFVSVSVGLQLVLRQIDAKMALLGSLASLGMPVLGP